MPNKLDRPCKYFMCPNTTKNDSGYCDEHNRVDVPTRQKPIYSKLYNTKQWANYRKLYIKENPLCVECLKNDRYNPSAVVDHIRPHKGNVNMFWDRNNHQALCKKCHDKKTAREDGGFGNKSKRNG